MLTFNFIYLNPLLMHLYYFDDGSVGSILFDIALMFTLLGPSTSWTWVLTVVGSIHVVDMYKFDPGLVRPLCGLGSWPLVVSVHFVDLYKFMTLVGSVHFLDLYKFVTLVGSVHFVDWGHDPWWGPSTLWTYKFVTLAGSVHFVDWFWPLVGFVHFVDL